MSNEHVLGIQTKKMHGIQIQIFDLPINPFRYSINVPKNTKFEFEIHKFDKFFRSDNSLKLRPALRHNIFVPAKRSKFAIFIEKENPHSFF